MYEPPFSISTEALSDVTEIARMLEKHKELLRVREALKLRRQSTVQSVYGSLAIEGSRMTEEQVEHILAGRDVIAPPREVQEVRNAPDAYALFGIKSLR